MYGIHPDYRHRASVEPFDDTRLVEEWQREVYEYARDIALCRGHLRVLDYGCGAARKLLEFFYNFETVGVDLPPTVDWLRQKHPDRRWEISTKQLAGWPHLLICADVIEHVPDPDALLDEIVRLAPRAIILSTPARELWRWPPNNAPLGPPGNPCHYREWTMDEFYSYIAQRCVIERHFVSNAEQATQCVLARVR